MKKQFLNSQSSPGHDGAVMVEATMVVMIVLFLTVGLINLTIYLSAMVLLNRACDEAMGSAVTNSNLLIDTHLDATSDADLETFKTARNDIIAVADGVLFGTFIDNRRFTFTNSDARLGELESRVAFLRPGDTWARKDSPETHISHPTRQTPPSASEHYRDSAVLGTHPYYMYIECSISLWPIGYAQVRGTSARWPELTEDLQTGSLWPTNVPPTVGPTETIIPSVTPTETSIPPSPTATSIYTSTPTNTPKASSTSTAGPSPTVPTQTPTATVTVTATASLSPTAMPPTITPAPTCDYGLNVLEYQPLGCCRAPDNPPPCYECVTSEGCCVSGACGS